MPDRVAPARAATGRTKVAKAPHVHRKREWSPRSAVAAPPSVARTLPSRDHAADSPWPSPPHHGDRNTARKMGITGRLLKSGVSLWHLFGSFLPNGESDARAGRRAA